MPEVDELSRFYFGSEELARELQRVLEAGALDQVLELLRHYDIELVLEARTESLGLRETIGRLRSLPKRPARSLPMAREESDDPLLRASGPWDALSNLRARSRIELVTPEGEVAEAYMPDHVCPRCLNEVGNSIESCRRRCASCDYEW